MDYNGWKNWATWNVALWIQNDESLYQLARDIARSKYTRPYISFVENLEDWDIKQTPDEASYRDPTLDIDALDEMIMELAS